MQKNQTPKSIVFRGFGSVGFGTQEAVWAITAGISKQYYLKN